MSKYFANCKTAEEFKKTFRKLCKELHPDNLMTGDAEKFKEMKAEFEKGFEACTAGTNEAGTAKEFSDIIEKFMKMDGLNIELCGSWLWISGNTYQNRENLKAAGCQWSRSKKMWYWHPGDYSKRRGGASMETIRNKYGSKKFVSSGSDRLSA